MTTDLISRAWAGDGDAFRELTEPYRRELQVHCYRMLAEQALVATFVRAYQSGNVDALVALLTADVCVSMPPIPLEYHGRDAVARFYASIIHSRTYDLVPTRANGQLAFGAYL